MPELVPLNDGTLSPEEFRRQAFLFDVLDLGSELLVIEEDRAANKHTGKTLERREELRDLICTRLCEGMSIRAVSRAYGVGRNTVSKLVQRLEAAGKMEPYKKRVSAKLGALVEAGVDAFMEKLANDEVPVNVIPVAVGIFSDKKALLDGEATTIVGTTAKPELSQEAWDKWFAALPQAVVVDAESTGNGGKAQ